MPYLFLVAMEFLAITLDMKYLKGNINPMYKIEPMTTRLFYADDILILGKATFGNAVSLQSIFQVLKSLTGLDINKNKSTLFFSKGANNKQQIANIPNINIGNLPIIYLGIPLSNNKLKARHYG